MPRTSSPRRSLTSAPPPFPRKRRRPHDARRSRARRVRSVHRPPPRATTKPTPAVVGETPPLFASVFAWLAEHLSAGGYHRPLLKRLAVLITGLVAGEAATVAGLAQTVHALALTPAQEPSIVRRVQRLEADRRLDPALVLPALFRSLLPTLLRAACTAHAANEPSGPAHHARFIAVRLVVDATTKSDQVHILTVGLAYQGIVVPLAVRSWEQNVPLPEGEYIAHLIDLLCEVNAALPAELRDHVLLLADRGFGTPRLLDLLRALRWHWVLRVQNQVTVQLADGRTLPIRDLATKPGALWVGTPSPNEADTPIAAFKGAGWRPCHVVAIWLPEQDEPWLLLTDLDAAAERLRDYAQRWAIERLFLSWKSHGWELEQVGLSDLVRIRSLLTGLVLATLWRLAAALPVAAHYLTELPTHTYPQGHQFRLHLSPTVPWPGKFSLFTWGTKTYHQSDPKTTTPTLCWAFPDWDAPRWSQRCLDAYHGVT